MKWGKSPTNTYTIARRGMNGTERRIEQGKHSI